MLLYRKVHLLIITDHKYIYQRVRNQTKKNLPTQLMFQVKPNINCLEEYQVFLFLPRFAVSII